MRDVWVSACCHLIRTSRSSSVLVVWHGLTFRRNPCKNQGQEQQTAWIDLVNMEGSIQIWRKHMETIISPSMNHRTNRRKEGIHSFKTDQRNVNFGLPGWLWTDDGCKPPGPLPFGRAAQDVAVKSGEMIPIQLEMFPNFPQKNNIYGLQLFIQLKFGIWTSWWIKHGWAASEMLRSSSLTWVV